MNLRCSKLVVGSSLDSIIYAYYNKYKVIYTRNLQPLEIEKIVNFGIGTDTYDIWNKHMYQLSIAGYIPFENKIKHLRYVSANTISAVTKNDTICNIQFEELHVFDDHEFLDLPLTTKSTSREYRVVDIFKYSKIAQLKLENIEQRTKFLNQIIFEDEKLIYTISYIKKNQIEEYDPALIKVKTESLLSIPKLNMDHIERHITDLGHNVYEDFDNVKFMHVPANLTYQFHRKRVKIDYMKYFKMKLGLR